MQLLILQKSAALAIISRIHAITITNFLISKNLAGHESANESTYIQPASGGSRTLELAGPDQYWGLQDRVFIMTLQVIPINYLFWNF